VKITWLIKEKSDEDARHFHNWLEKLRDHNRMRIERFLLIDFEKFKKNPAYHTTVSNIWSTYLPTSANPRYVIFVANTAELSAPLKNDFSIITVGDVRYAQTSAVDTIGASQQEVLRIFFSQAKDDVDHITENFSRLSTDAMSVANFAALEQELNSGSGHR
jgi:hypothetical protein